MEYWQLYLEGLWLIARIWAGTLLLAGAIFGTIVLLMYVYTLTRRTRRRR